MADLMCQDSTVLLNSHSRSGTGFVVLARHATKVC